MYVLFSLKILIIDFEYQCFFIAIVVMVKCCELSKSCFMFQELLSVDQYRAFELSRVERVTQDSWRYTFDLPVNQCLPIGLAQHLVMRSGY